MYISIVFLVIYLFDFLVELCIHPQLKMTSYENFGLFAPPLIWLVDSFCFYSITITFVGKHSIFIHFLANLFHKTFIMIILLLFYLIFQVTNHWFLFVVFRLNVIIRFIWLHPLISNFLIKMTLIFEVDNFISDCFWHFLFPFRGTYGLFLEGFPGIWWSILSN